MAAICRLAGRQLCLNLAKNNQNGLLILRPLASSTPLKKDAIIDHDAHNAKLGRPMSPHLTIYAPQITSMLSITHRITGCALAGYVTLFGIGSLFVGDYTTAIQNLHMPFACLFSIKFMLSVPFTFHFVNGIRHLFWDCGKYLTNREVNTTGMAVLGATGVLSIIMALL